MMNLLPSNRDDMPTRVTKLRRIMQMETMAMLVLVAVLVAAYFTHEKPVFYFAMNSKNQTKPVLDLIAPTYTDQAIATWIGSAASDILNFGFQNVEQRMNQNRKYFTETGWKSFVKAIEKSKLVEKITTKQQVVTAAPIGAAVIIDRKDRGILGPEWTLQIPFTVTVLSGKLTQTQKRFLTVVIVRVPPSVNLNGLGIDNWVESI